MEVDEIQQPAFFQNILFCFQQKKTSNSFEEMNYILKNEDM